MALTPVWSAAIAFWSHWVPSSDWAVVVSKSLDTFSSHPPLIGQWTSLSSYVGYDVHQPGPLQFWIQGVFERLFAPSVVGSLIGQALLATGAAVAWLVAAARRGGTRLVGPAAVVLALLFHSLGAETLRSPYNPSAAVIGLIAFMAAAWSILCEDDAFWPVLIFAGSLSIQTHVTYLVPMSCIGLVLVASHVLRWRHHSGPARSRRYVRTLLGVSTATAVLCWIGPIIDQFWGSGNLWRLVRAGSQATNTVGSRFALDRMGEQLGVPPRWLFSPWDYGLGDPTLWTWVSAALVGSALVAAVVVSRRSGSAPRFRLGVLVLAAGVGACISTARIPDEPLARVESNLWLFWWPIAAFAWFFLAWTLVAVLAPHVRRAIGERRLVASGAPMAALALVAIIASTVFLTRAASPRQDSVSITYGEVAAFSAVVVPLCDSRSGPIAVTGDVGANAGSMSGVVAILRLHGCDIHTTNWRYFGKARRVTNRERIEVRILGTPVAPPGFHLIATYDPAHPPARWKDFHRAALFTVVRRSYLYQRGG